VNKIKVVIADDHPGFREGLCRFLDEQDDMECIGCAGDGEEAIKLARDLEPEIAMIDIAMPKISGIEVARRMKTIRPSIAIIMVSAFDYESYILASLSAGASGYLVKNIELRGIANAIRSVHAGEVVYALEASKKILARINDRGSRHRVGSGILSERELEILRLAAKGMSNKNIAKELTISLRTVQTHLVSIFRKLEVGSRTEAVLRVLREGWLTLGDI